MPYLAFARQSEALIDRYRTGFSLSELCPISGTGVVTKRDKLNIHFDRSHAWQAALDLLTAPEQQVRSKYDLPDDVRDWHYNWAVADVSASPSPDKVRPIAYRPFDRRFVYYTGLARGMVGWPVKRVMRHFSPQLNIGISVGRQGQVVGSMPWNLVINHAELTDFNMFYRGGAFSAPLYCYPDGGDQTDVFSAKHRTPNLDPKLYAAICRAAGLDPADQAGPDDDFRAATGDARPSEVKVFDYIYGVLHAPAYRETFAEFLKIDFPRIPYPPSPQVFRAVSEQGEALRRLHLMEPAAIGDTAFRYEGDGDDVVASGYPKYEAGKVYINKDQYFADVPAIAWSFPIGGYLPAQKWLKDRRGRALSWDDIGHYQKIVKILEETDRIMATIALPLD